MANHCSSTCSRFSLLDHLRTKFPQHNPNFSPKSIIYPFKENKPIEFKLEQLKTLTTKIQISFLGQWCFARNRKNLPEILPFTGAGNPIWYQVLEPNSRTSMIMILNSEIKNITSHRDGETGKKNHCSNVQIAKKKKNRNIYIAQAANSFGQIF